MAIDISWTGAAGTPLSFGTPGNWNPAQVPSTGDNAFINNGGISTVGAAQAHTPASFLLGSAAGASGSIQQTGGSMTTTAASYIGASPGGTGGAGTYAISGGSMTVNGGDLWVGGGLAGASGAGNGTLAISGTGSVRVPGNLHFGSAGTASGTLNLSGGSLTVGGPFQGTVFIGENGTGFANISGGTLTVPNMLVGRIPGGGGTVTQTGGFMNITNNLVMFERAPDSTPGAAQPDFYNMSAGTLAVGNELYVGAHGESTFNLSGTGVVSVVGTIHVAASSAFSDPPGGIGTLNMSGGSLSASGNSGFIVVGDGGLGTFNLSGGNVSTKFYNIGQNFGAVGVVNQTGGTVTADFALVVGEVSRGNNLYDLSGGSLTVAGSGDTNPGDANLGSGNGGKGTMIVRNTGVLTIANSLRLGGSGAAAGTLDVRTGASITLGTNGIGGGRLLVGDMGLGTVLISGGALSVDSVTFGQNASAVGVGTQTGGRVNVNTDFTVGEAATGANSYSISDGTLTVGLGVGGGSVFVGSTGAGTFRVSGNANVSAASGITNGLMGSGTVLISGGTVTAGGLNNRTNYTQSGGTATLGVVSGAGTMNVSAGTANVVSIGQSSLSISGTGRVNTGSNTSAVSVVNNLSITNSGVLNLNNGNLVVDYTGASPLAAIQALVTSGYAGGSWNGVGINSTAAAATTGTALGYGEASAVNLTTIGTTAVDSTSVVVRYTLQGDANLDRRVNINDFALLAANFGQPGGWTKGNFNFDNVVNIQDFALLAARFGQIISADLPRASAVPEPATALTTLAAGAVLATRRRRAK